jgi:oligopeptide transport system permease protein
MNVMTTTKAKSESLDPTLTPDMFKPKRSLSEDGEIISRPNLSYFQDAVIRFKKNRLGVSCALFLLTMTAIGIIGPFFFPDMGEDFSYENALNTDFQNQEPSLGETLLVTDESVLLPDVKVKSDFNLAAPLLTAESIKPPVNFKIVGSPTVDGITLEWDPVEGVSGYEIYRGSAKKGSLNLEEFKGDPLAAGMSVVKIEDPAQASYSDSMGLDQSYDYVYAIVSFVNSPETNEQIASSPETTQMLSMTKTIRLSEAQHIDPQAEVGKTVKSRVFLFGTDSLGRDIFARMIVGIRVNFSLALIVPTICLLIGLVYGAIAGLKGGKVDMILMRIIEILDTLPYLLLMIILQLVLGKGMISLIVALCAFGWTGFARVIRGEVLKLREIEFVHASKLLGAPLSRLVFKQIAPNLIGLILVVWSSQLPGVIVSEAFLSLLGLGLEAPQASWGMVLNESAQQFQSHPLQFLLPASVMGSTLLAFFLLGDALTDTLDPKLRGRG